MDDDDECGGNEPKFFFFVSSSSFWLYFFYHLFSLFFLCQKFLRFRSACEKASPAVWVCSSEWVGLVEKFQRVFWHSRNFYNSTWIFFLSLRKQLPSFFSFCCFYLSSSFSCTGFSLCWSKKTDDLGHKIRTTVEGTHNLGLEKKLSLFISTRLLFLPRISPSSSHHQKNGFLSSFSYNLKLTELSNLSFMELFFRQHKRKWRMKHRGGTQWAVPLQIENCTFHRTKGNQMKICFSNFSGKKILIIALPPMTGTSDLISPVQYAPNTSIFLAWFSFGT